MRDRKATLSIALLSHFFASPLSLAPSLLKVVKDAEEYYRGMFLAKNTWNIRDKHMATTLNELMNHITQVRQNGNNPAQSTLSLFGCGIIISLLSDL